MLFNSQIFIFVFLPIVLIGYYSLSHYQKYSFAKAFLLIASLIFYGFQTPVYLLLLIASICINYLLYKWIKIVSANEKKGVAKAIMLCGVALNLASIFYFKYYNFFMSNLNLVFKLDVKLLNVVLPLGISFFTFQQVSFLVDTYKGEVDDFSFLDYSLFVAFFPQLIAGPIVLHKDLIGQFSEKERFHLYGENMLIGVRYFVIGLFKKTIVADRFSMLVGFGYEHLGDLSSFGAILVVLSYTLQIYFDFSGYSDMAIGLGKMLGFDLPKNFVEPYKAKNISEFWKGWHMTMTRFFTQYVYIPLGGSRRGTFRTCLNTVIVFGLSGLWHGAGWTFIFWGLMHGVAMVFHRLFGKTIGKLPSLFTCFVTFCYVNLAWVFFRAEYFGQAKSLIMGMLKGGMKNNVHLYQSLIGDNLTTIISILFENSQVQDILCTVFCIFLVIVVLLVTFLGKSSHELAKRETIGRFEGILLGCMFVLSTMTFMNVSEFLYFNF